MQPVLIWAGAAAIPGKRPFPGRARDGLAGLANATVTTYWWSCRASASRKRAGDRRMYRPPWSADVMYVTANEGPAAFAYRELAELARETRRTVPLRKRGHRQYPIFSLGRALHGLSVTRFSGIFNTTTNFVLSRLEAGESMDAAVRTAQRLGFAEADPDLDLDGWDSAARPPSWPTSSWTLASIRCKSRRRGIQRLTPESTAKAAAAGRRIKLICRGWRRRRMSPRCSRARCPSTNISPRSTAGRQPCASNSTCWARSGSWRRAPT